MSKKISKSDRHSTVKNTATPPVPPPFISTGKHDKRILTYLSKQSIKKYSHRSSYLNLGISKSSYTDSLKRMANNKLIVLQKYGGKPLVTELGKGVADLPDHGPQGVAECCQLSTHKIEYKIDIIDGSKIPMEKIRQLKDTIDKPKEYYLKGNNRVVNIYFQQETIVLHDKTLYIKVHELLGNTEETQQTAFKIALERLKQLNEIGLKDGKIELTDSHYEIARNRFSEILNNIEHNFYLDLGNGKRLWIDHSKKDKKDEGTQGIESNSPEVINKVKDLYKDVCISEHRFKDIGEIKEDLSDIKEALKLCLENFTTILNIERQRMQPIKPEPLNEKPYYFQ